MKPLLTKEELADLLSPPETEPETIDPAESKGKQISIEVGRKLLSDQEIKTIQKGGLILLNKETDALLDVYCNNQLIARGKPVTIGGKIGITLTEIMPCSTTISHDK